MGHEPNRKKIYKNADLLIHCSVFEGLPNVIVEALNYNVPVIAANGAGGIREVLCLVNMVNYLRLEISKFWLKISITLF